MPSPETLLGIRILAAAGIGIYLHSQKVLHNSREVRDMIIHARGGKSGVIAAAHDHALRYCTSSQQHRDGRDGLQASSSSVSGQATTTTSAATSSVRRSDLLPRRRSSNRRRDHRAPALEIGGGRSTSIGRQAMRRRWCREVHADRRTVL